MRRYKRIKYLKRHNKKVQANVTVYFSILFTKK